MDRKWMSSSRVTPEYIFGVDNFISFAVKHAENHSRILCPCKNFLNTIRSRVDTVKDHLIANGIDQSYTCWIWHGEKEVLNINVDKAHDYECDRLEEMAQAVQDNFVDRPSQFKELLTDAKLPLYPLCTKFMKLSVVLKLYNLKAAHGWTDKSFTALLEVIEDMLPSENVLPKRTYEAKKVIFSLAINYKRIHTCPNDCILYRNDYESYDKFPNPNCRESRYKREGVPAMVFWYLLIFPRFKRLFSNEEDEKCIIWHAEGREFDGNIRHPTDAQQWKAFDNLYPEFSNDPRNLLLALSSDGMNPHGNQSSTHSTWPVVLIIYNIPSSICTMRKYMMLSMLISGPKQLGNDIHVYLQPLVDDLNVMWDSGIEAYDAYRKETFCLRAMLFCTINDFQTYGNLSGYSVKGHEACPLCGKDTDHCWLKHCRKTVYVAFRRFPPMDHRYRKLRIAFNGEAEERGAPKPFNVKHVLEIVDGLNITYGKKHNSPLPSKGWKKKSLFSPFRIGSICPYKIVLM